MQKTASSETWKGSKILISGSAGFLGSHLTDEFINEGFDVYGIDNLSGGSMDNVNPKCKFHKVDLRNRFETECVVEEIKADVLYHLAADATEGRSQFTPTSAIENNLNAYINILIPFLKNGGKKVVLFSSMSVYGAGTPPFSEADERKPVDVYGQAKRAMEEITEILADIHGFEYCIIRPHNVYGERQRLDDPYRNVVGIFINRMLQDLPLIIYGDGEQRRAFSYIGDMVKPMVKAMDIRNEIINLGAEKDYSIKELANFISSKHIHIEDRPREVKVAYSTTEKSKQLLNFCDKTPLKIGIAKTIDWAVKTGFIPPQYLDELEIDLLGIAPKTWREKLI